MSDRPLDKGLLEVLTMRECLAHLAAEPVGRIAFVEAGQPTILPVNHVLDGEAILFRTTHGARLSVAALTRPVAFEADGYDPGTRTGWSVLVRGRAEELSPSGIAERLTALGYAPWADHAQRDQWIRVAIQQVTGRRIPDRG